MSGLPRHETALDLRIGAAVDLTGTGLAIAHIRIFGTTATILHRVDAHEHDRRLRHTMGALRSLELIDVLLDLPAHEPVPLASLTTSTSRILRTAPPGIVTFTEVTVVRQAIPVTRPALAIVRVRTGRVTTTRFRDALSRASQFATYCPRLLLVPAAPEEPDELLAEASWYGIGVAAGPLDAAIVLVEPEAVTDWQPTAA